MSSYSNSYFKVSPILTEIVAAANSNLGMLTVFFGVTRDFPVTNETCTLPFSSPSLKYEHRPYLHIEASDIQWSCADTIFPNSLGLKLLDTFKFSSRPSSFRHFSHQPLVASSTGSSQLLVWQMSCNIFFPTSTMGAMKSKGS